ncbi:MAG: permease [Candidatus Omnitrophica bacterium]|nr:permease [Candidatus Omnitrophota bacterium]
MKSKWYQRPIVWLSACLVLLLALSYWIDALKSFRHMFVSYARIMLVPVLLGLLAGGIIDHFIPREYISRYLARKTKRTVFLAAGLGFLASACSHGVIALAMEIHKKGASGPAVISFLLASPWANLPVTFLMIGFFGWKAWILILSAITVALTTGLAFQLLDRKGLIEVNRHTAVTDPGFSIRQDLMRRWSGYKFSFQQLRDDARGVLRGTRELAGMVLGWILFGVILASLAGAFIPSRAFQAYLGPSIGGLLATIAAAAVIEVCSEGTSPLAFEIYRQTGALGNAFAFLMGGVVTDYTELGLVWTRIGPRTALWTIALTLPQVFFMALIFNQLGKF